MYPNTRNMAWCPTSQPLLNGDDISDTFSGQHIGRIYLILTHYLGLLSQTRFNLVALTVHRTNGYQNSNAKSGEETTNLEHLNGCCTLKRMVLAKIYYECLEMDRIIRLEELRRVETGMLPVECFVCGQTCRSSTCEGLDQNGACFIRAHAN